MKNNNGFSIERELDGYYLKKGDEKLIWGSHDTIKKMYDVLTGLTEEIKDYNDTLARLEEDLKKALPVLLAIDFRMSISECEALNRLCKFVDDEFIAGKDCDKQ